MDRSTALTSGTLTQSPQLTFKAANPDEAQVWISRLLETANGERGRQVYMLGNITGFCIGIRQINNWLPGNFPAKT